MVLSIQFITPEPFISNGSRVFFCPGVSVS